VSVRSLEPITNVSAHLRLRAAEAPERVAVRGSDGRELTFGELDRRVDAVAHGLGEIGFVRGDRACLFVRPGPELVLLTHAMLRAGVSPVLIDPGMGRRSLFACVERVAPRGLIGIPRAHAARLLFPRSFRSVELSVIVGAPPVFAGLGGLGGHSLARLLKRGLRRGPAPDPTGLAADPDAEAAVLFTSGSTGPPKGVVYLHRNFLAQLESLRALYDLTPGEVDVPCFPLFALFDNALGMTSVFPELDPSRPAECDPARIHAAIEESGATFTFGSPAIWKRLVPWAREHGARFTRLRRLTIAGAPVAPSLVADLKELLPADGEVHTPYGATEALPITSVSGTELAGRLRARIEGGEGSCVGRPVPGVELALVRITDEPIVRWSQDLVVPAGAPGEVCVRCRAATPAYVNDDLATRAAKIPDGSGGSWHRMGDVGRLDKNGLLWLLGRKSHRIETVEGLVMPVPVENVFQTAKGVRRVALVGVGRRGTERPLLVVEVEPGADEAAVEARLRSHRRDVPATWNVSTIRFHPSLPVDVRHNAKIRREELKRWAEARGL